MDSKLQNSNTDYYPAMSIDLTELVSVPSVKKQENSLDNPTRLDIQSFCQLEVEPRYVLKRK